MAKINPIFGKFQGKLGGTVFAIRNGEQILREYNPAPLNPKSDAQIASRAKLKLLSQLSADYAPIIAIKRKGMVSARNLFFKRNYMYAGFDGQKAEITLADVQLTNSAVSLAGFSIDRSGANMSLELLEDMSSSIDRVVYVVIKKSDNNELIITHSEVVDVDTAGGTFGTTMPMVNGEIVVMAYGIRLNNKVARIAFGNLTALTAEEVAHLVVTMTNADTAITLTETRGLQLAADETQGETTGALRVNVTPIVSSASTGTGTVSGGGRVDAGESVTLVASPAEGNTFRGWFSEDNQINTSYRLSVDRQWTFAAGDVNQTFYAVFMSGGEG